VHVGETVAITGGGTIGLLVLQVARAAGASAAYLIEPRSARRDLGLTLSATAAFSPDQPEWQEALREACVEVILGERRLVGSVQHHYDDDLPTAVQMIAEGKVRVGPLITAREPLERVVADGFRALIDNPDQHLKILIGPNL
jgi:(R,R)-butanediol dehydrogenase / meso-butanediol dehydrogenase / diacetyl reductase